MYDSTFLAQRTDQHVDFDCIPKLGAQEHNHVGFTKALESIEAEMQANVAPKRREWLVRRDALMAKLSEAIRVEAKGKVPIRSPLEIGEELRQHEENEIIISPLFR